TGDCSECATGGCSATFIEQHDGFDLAYVEFTERGNVFDRRRMKRVLDHVGDRARYDRDNSVRGITTIVFVHGWKHNASADDENVESFRRMLHKTAELTKDGPRKLIGIYVGWRGRSIDWDVLDNISYWDRKAVAQQVAEGGVTEVLLRLEREVIDDERPNRNLYLVTAHSFGGAVALSALNEILLERVVKALASSSDDDCVETRPFGHGVVLLNPAIEANEAFQLKELVAETCFVDTQDRLMHVISSDADEATNVSFGMGQRLGVNLTWKQTELTREFDDKKVRLHESALDTTTVGDFMPFQTGQLNAGDTGWVYSSCVGEGTDDACIGADGVPHIPAKRNEPLAFIQTDE
ncbi:MAG: alpha/beta hydrolase, partial [Nitrospirota bacterium]|nr:alpha/beta hydrolase [Nitrospirota bacterium]